MCFVDLFGHEPIGSFYSPHRRHELVMITEKIWPELKRVLLFSLPDQLVGGYFMPQAAQEMIRPGCVLCEFVMYRLQEWLQDDHTQEDIQQGLTRVCQVGALTQFCYYPSHKKTLIVLQCTVGKGHSGLPPK